MKYLILGANGYIGHYLYTRMKENGIEVIGTARDCQRESDFMYFDLLKDRAGDIGELMGDNEKTAIFCIAQTSIDRCKLEYEISRQINVTAAKELIDRLIQKNFRVIYFSTDNVFDGIKGDYTEQDRTNPINEYGKMKAEMERFLTDKYPDVCIFRLPKVIGVKREKKNMLMDLESCSNGKTRCIKDMKMSIVSKEDIYQACLIASKRRMKGLYNLSNGEVWERKKLVEIFFQYMGICDRKIEELEIEQFHFVDIRPLNIGLNNFKFINETGYEFKSFEMIAKQYAETAKGIFQ